MVIREERKTLTLDVWCNSETQRNKNVITIVYKTWKKPYAPYYLTFLWSSSNNLSLVHHKFYIMLWYNINNGLVTMLEWESHFISSHLHSHRHILSILSIKQSQWFHIKHVKPSENNIGKCEMALYLIECELQDIFLPASHLPNTHLASSIRFTFM